MLEAVTGTGAQTLLADGVLRLCLAGERHVELPLMWLRDRCTCSTCQHASGQRLLDPATINIQSLPTDIHVDNDTLRLTWMPESHISTYAINELFAAPVSPPTARGWDASAASDLPSCHHDTIIGHDPAARSELLQWLRATEQMGCGVMHGVPVADGEVARVATLFGHVRETNYGRWFDVRSVVDPTNLANTSFGLAAHTDNPYRDPVPTLQLLHCLESSASGGENVLVDGWRVADEVRSQQPDGFDLLVRRSVSFCYRDANTDLAAIAPLIELDTEGAVRSIRFNARSMQPPSMPSTELSTWYDAYLLFARLLTEPRFQIRLRLDPGDLFIVDNQRVLHGRTAYAATSGSRHLQGCYADIDGLRSTIRVLSRMESSSATELR